MRGDDRKNDGGEKVRRTDRLAPYEIHAYTENKDGAHRGEIQQRFLRTAR